MKEIRFTLGGEEYTVPPLNLGQIEDVLAASATPLPDDPAAGLRARFQRMREIVAAALRGDPRYPAIAPDDLRGWTLTQAELVEANNAILTGSGLAGAGEEVPAAPRVAAVE